MEKWRRSDLDLFYLSNKKANDDDSEKSFRFSTVDDAILKSTHNILYNFMIK